MVWVAPSGLIIAWFGNRLRLGQVSWGVLNLWNSNVLKDEVYALRVRAYRAMVGSRSSLRHVVCVWLSHSHPKQYSESLIFKLHPSKSFREKILEIA